MEDLKARRGHGASRVAAALMPFPPLQRRPIAEQTRAANEQHYEVPTEFYLLCLGKHLKYRWGGRLVKCTHQRCVPCASLTPFLILLACAPARACTRAYPPGWAWTRPRLRC